MKALKNRFAVAATLAILLVLGGVLQAAEVTDVSLSTSPATNPVSVTVAQGSTTDPAWFQNVNSISGSVPPNPNNPPNLVYCKEAQLGVDGGNNVILTCLTTDNILLEAGRNYTQNPLTSPLTRGVKLIVLEAVPCGTYDRTVTIHNTPGSGVDFGEGESGTVTSVTLSIRIIVECEQTSIQGCSHGYWKNHTASWQGFAPSATVGSVFSAAAGGDFASVTLLEALQLPGGRGVSGATQILLREAVAALLNAAHPNVNFAFSVGSVQSQVNAAISSGNRTTILNAKDVLEAENAGTSENPSFCPLN